MTTGIRCERADSSVFGGGSRAEVAVAWAVTLLGKEDITILLSQHYRYVTAPPALDPMFWFQQHLLVPLTPKALLYHGDVVEGEGGRRFGWCGGWRCGVLRGRRCARGEWSSLLSAGSVDGVFLFWLREGGFADLPISWERGRSGLAVASAW